MHFRENFTKLAKALIAENKRDSAIAVLDKCIAVVPASKIPDDVQTLAIIETYCAAGAKNKGAQVLKNYFEICNNELAYYFSLKPTFKRLIDYDIRYNMSVIAQMAEIAKANNFVMQNNIIGNLNQYSKQYNESH